MMSVFKVVPHDRAKKVAIKASTVQELMDKAIVKLGLAEGIYQVALEEDGTEVDEDDVLLDMAKTATSTLTLMLIPQGRHWQDALAAKKAELQSSTLITAQPESTLTQPATSVPVTSQLSVTEPDMVSGSNLWYRFPQRLVRSCENQQRVRDDDRRAMVAVIADYMLQDLKDSSRKTAERIARGIFEKYPESFSDMIGGEIIGHGMESLRSQIYTAVHYRKDNRTSSKRPAETGSDDSDSENSSVASSVSRKQDEYGCVDYQPLLPSDETKASQEEKRLVLIQYYTSPDSNTEKIETLLDDTYATQRAEINKKSRDLVKFFIEWPFFKEAKTLIAHASRLLGKPVLDTWNKSLEQKTKPILKYLKSMEVVKHHKNRKLKRTSTEVQENYILDMLRLAKDHACLTTRSEAPYHEVLFPLIVYYMKEELDLLFMVVDDDTLTTEVIQQKATGMTPVLMIRGKSFFDENARYVVVLEQKLTITTVNLLQGLLITFLSYYIFGYAYPEKLSSTLEFIQRVILGVNPVKGDKRDSKKRRARSYDPKVFKLTKDLNDFTNQF